MRSRLCLFAVCAFAAGAASAAGKSPTAAADEKALRAECVERMRGWTKFCKSYRPDYSDSSKFLDPPQTGRLKRPLPLVVGGKPNAEIVYTPDALGVVSNAADELQFWVKKMSGAELPLRKGEGPAPVKIILNAPAAARKYAVDVAWLAAGADCDGYFVHADGNRIYIGCAVPSGFRPEHAKHSQLPPRATPAGIFRGVYALLENNFPIIFAYPDEKLGNVYDETNNLAVVWAEGRDRPLTNGRGWLGGSAPATERFGAARWRSRNGDTCVSPALGGHDGMIYGDFQGYLPNTPDYQAQVDNRRLPFNYYDGQVCLNGPDAVDLVLKKMRSAIDARRATGRAVASIQWGDEDNWRVCTCPACTAPIKLPDGTVLTSNGKSEKETMEPGEIAYRSTQFYMFANRLAEGLHKTHPEVRLSVLSYFFMGLPPKVPLAHGMGCTYAPYYTRRNYVEPTFAPVNQNSYFQWRTFQKLGGTVSFFDYDAYYEMNEARRFRAEAMREDIRCYAEHGCVDIGAEMLNHKDPPGWFEQWMWERLCWNYEADTERLRKYYLRRVYREGAPAAERYFGSYREQRFHPDSNVKPVRGEEAQKLFAKYLPKIRNPIARANFELLMKDAINSK